jgi:carboxyl-terminal processing protease
MKRYLMVLLLLGAASAAHAGETSERDPEGPYKKLDVFSHVLSLIENNYVESADETKLLYGAIEGMVRTLDPHSSFMDPKTYSALKQETEGEYGGIGLELETRADDVVVVAPIDGTPASRAGFQPGDKLLEIDGVVLNGWHEGDAVRALLGPPGTKVVVKLSRASWPEPRSFTLVRDVIRVVSVESKLFDKKFGYVKIKNFQDRTDAYLKKALDALRAGAHGELSGVVLDLRHNPGGLLDQGVKVADRFLDSGIIVTTKGRGGRHVEIERAHHKDTEPRYPMVVLVDGGTASASEIVAGALQDHGRAVVIGTQSYGKGSVQTVIELEDGSGLKLTIARYYTPSGRSIQERGITPDVWVKASASASAAGPALTPSEEEQREDSLPGHFKGDLVAEQAAASLKPPIPQPLTPDDPKNDAQLKVALDTLRTWQIFKQTLPRETAVRAASAH